MSTDESTQAQPTDEQPDLDDVPAVAGGNDDTEPAQGEGEQNAY